MLVWTSNVNEWNVVDVDCSFSSNPVDLFNRQQSVPWKLVMIQNRLCWCALTASI